MTKGIKNIKLEKNPNPDDPKSSHFIPKVEREAKENFGRKYKNYSFTDGDRKKVNNFIKNNKK